MKRKNKDPESEKPEISETLVKKKMKKKKRDAHMDVSDSSDMVANLKNEDLKGRKKETHKTKRPLITPEEGTEEAKDVEDVGLDEEELSPEERRVLERKLKKIRKKEAKKMKAEEKKAEDSKSGIAQKQALDYLTCWSEKRAEWKFQKTRQVWLLQNMYDSEKVSDAYFSVLLSYLEGLQGVARETTVQKAEALVRFGEGPEEEGGVATVEAQTKTQRAREVIQFLS